MKSTIVHSPWVALTLIAAADCYAPPTSHASVGQPASNTALPAAAPQRALDYGKLPLSFEPNRGQTDPRVDFVARGPNYTLFLGARSATFSLSRSTGERLGPGKEQSVIRMDLSDSNPRARMQAQEPQPGIVNYLQASKAGESLRSLPTYARTRVNQVYPGVDLIYYGTNGRLEYDFVVAPGADTDHIRLRFAGAKPAIAANGDLVLGQHGRSIGKVPGKREVRFLKPVVYQDIAGQRLRVDGRFTVATNHAVGFRIGAYDHRYPLTVDPVLAYSSFIGGSAYPSTPNAMALNNAGQIYITGSTQAVDYPTTPGVLFTSCPAPMTGQTKCGPSSTFTTFVSKIAADGQSLIYSTYLGGSGAGNGGSGAEYAYGVAVGANDEAWIVGNTNSNNFPISGDALLKYCTPAGGSYNFNTGLYTTEISGCAGYNAGQEYIYGPLSIFLVKLNSTGTSILYGTFLGGSATNQPTAVALDSAGNVYVTGFTSASGYVPAVNIPPPNSGQYNFPTTASAYLVAGPAISQIGYVGFLSEISADGHMLLYSTLVSGSSVNSTYPLALAVSGVGKVAIGGYTQSSTFPTTAGALQSSCPTNGTVGRCGANIGFVQSYDTTKSGNASLVFSTYLSGQTPATSDTYVSGLAADTAGNTYATGPLAQFDFPTTAGALQATCNHSAGGVCHGAFVTKLKPSGQIAWSTMYTSPSSNGPSNPPVLALDSQRNVYISANDDGGGDIPLKNPFQAYQSGFAYITELSSDGSQVLFGSYYGSGANILPTSIATDASRNIYVVGYTAGGLPLVNAFQSTNAGGYNEGFFAKVSALPTYSAGQLSVPSVAIGNAIYSNVIVTVGKIVSGPTGGGPYGTVASYNPANNVLTIPAGIVGSNTYYNVGVTVRSLLSLDDVAGADSFDGSHLSIPSVQVGGTVYHNVIVTVSKVINVAGGMPIDTQDQFNLANRQLTIPAVQVGSRAYTNVTIAVGAVVSIGSGGA